MPAPLWLGGALAGGGQILGGLLGRSGQHSANAANLAIARENREWQERMSNTAYQRAAKDLDAAGLNRILALGSPSSTPAGNIATMQNVNKPLQEGISGGITSAIQARLVNQQIKNMEEQRKLTEAQRKAIAPASTVGEILEASKGQIDYPNIISETPNTIRYGLETLRQSAKANIDRIAETVRLNPDKTRRELLKILNEMDLPAHVKTDAQKYQWALDNPEKIKRYMERKYSRGFQ